MRILSNSLPNETMCCCCCKHFLQKSHHLGWMMIHELHSCTVWSPVSSALSLSFYSVICSLYVFCLFYPLILLSIIMLNVIHVQLCIYFWPSSWKQSSYCLLLHPVIRERITTTWKDVRLLYHTLLHIQDILYT